MRASPPSADCGGMEELIKDQINGFIFSKREPKQIVEIIKKFINMDVNMIDAIITNAKTTVREKHLLKQQLDSFIDFYKSVKLIKNEKKY